MSLAIDLQRPYKLTEGPQAADGVHKEVKEYLYGSVIDLGCGHGLFNADAHIDVFTRQDLKCFHKVDLSTECLPFKNKTFEVALLVEVIEHLENPWNAIREAKRVAERIIITTPSTTSLRNKLIFLFRSRFYLFGHEKDKYHVTPIFPFQLDLMRGSWKLTSRKTINEVIIEVWDDEE